MTALAACWLVFQWNMEVFIYLFIVFCLFRATPAAHGGSQDRGWMETVATGLHSHSNSGSEPRLRPTPSSQQHQILNPLSKARDSTCIFVDTNGIHFPWATAGTPWSSWESPQKNAKFFLTSAPLHLLLPLSENMQMQPFYSLSLDSLQAGCP